MGHVRLGSLPRSRAWKEVVGLITAGADVSQIANATIRAADKAFSFVFNDEGFTEAVWLMTQLAIAAKKDNFNDHLQSVGINLPQDTSLPDVSLCCTKSGPKCHICRGCDCFNPRQNQRVMSTSRASPKRPIIFNAYRTISKTWKGSGKSATSADTVFFDPMSRM